MNIPYPHVNKIIMMTHNIMINHLTRITYYTSNIKYTYARTRAHTPACPHSYILADIHSHTYSARTHTLVHDHAHA